MQMCELFPKKKNVYLHRESSSRVCVCALHSGTIYVINEKS